MKVSICIPAYKQPDFLKRCIDSVLEQSYSDYEIVVTDDSPDYEVEVLMARYTDNRIRYYHNDTALGSPANWNKGIQLAVGEYIQILHHDDWFATRESLKNFVDAIQNTPEANIIFSACNTVYPDGSTKKHITAERYLNLLRSEPEALFKGNFLGAPSICMFRNDGHLFDVNLKWQVDSDFYISYLKMNPNFVYISNLLINIGVSDSQITNCCLNDYQLLITEKLYLYRKYELDTFSSDYRHSVLRTLGRGKVFNNKQLNKIISDTDIHITRIDSLKNCYYYLRHYIYRKLFKK